MRDSTAVETVAVIMAGGAGTRFWPLSTEEKPKQFLRLFGDRSLLRMSYERAAGLAPPERILVLTNRRFADLVREQVPEIPPSNVVGEPMRRDTAAAVAFAAYLCRKRHGNPVMSVLTADHLIEPVDAFLRAHRSAGRAASESGALYTFGIPPTYPAVAYGYLELGETLLDDDGVGHHRLLRFKEKPDAETARRYVESGNFLWNSGMFVWSVASVLAEIERQLPDHAAHLAPAADRDGRPDFDAALEKAFGPLESTSVDFGVMENAASVRCVRAPFAWEDVGGWLALEPHLEEDAGGNAARGRLESLGAGGNLVFCDDPAETVALVGVDDLIVVRAGKTTLVTSKARAEEIKALVKRIGEKRDG
jgi:mannose-1-phosphate guanylyltransferase